MDPSLADMWDRALEILEQQLPESDLAKPSFVTWLKNTRPLAFHGDTIVVGVPNDFAREWLETRYAGLLRRSLHSLVQRNLNLRFVIPRHEESPPAALETAAALADPVPYNGEVATAVLNPRYTFESFVVGNSNRFAHAAAQAVAEAPARAYNPLFVYGGVGLGKTHLMQAIGHVVTRRHQGLRVAYLTSEAFVNEFINSIRDDKIVAFQNKYRSVDVLLVDDIQFLAGKERTQEEFFHTFNALYEASRQIVISSDRPPKEIPTLEDRLRSRFEWGLITDIQAPDLETREAILRKKAQLEGASVPNDVVQYIASRIESNIRELEGALIRVMAYASMVKAQLTVELASSVLKDILPPPRTRPVTPAGIQAAVANHFDLTVAELVAKKRSRGVVLPRQIAMFLCRELTDASLPRIGEAFGGRDHTTVLHAHEKISRELKSNPELRQVVSDLVEKIRNG